jgi:nitrogen regulatory protein PII
VNTVSCKLLTIIAEDELEDRLLADLDAVGAKGYTVATVRGKGSHRVRATEWEGENVMVETIVSEEVAERIFERLEKAYFASYGVTAFLVDAKVVRGSKYL